MRFRQIDRAADRIAQNLGRKLFRATFLIEDRKQILAMSLLHVQPTGKKLIDRHFAALQMIIEVSYLREDPRFDAGNYASSVSRK